MPLFYFEKGESACLASILKEKTVSASRAKNKTGHFGLKNLEMVGAINRPWMGHKSKHLRSPFSFLQMKGARLLIVCSNYLELFCNLFFPRARKMGAGSYFAHAFCVLGHSSYAIMSLNALLSSAYNRRWNPRARGLPCQVNIFVAICNLRGKKRLWGEHTFIKRWRLLTDWCSWYGVLLTRWISPFSHPSLTLVRACVLEK